MTGKGHKASLHVPIGGGATAREDKGAERDDMSNQESDCQSGNCLKLKPMLKEGSKDLGRT